VILQGNIRANGAELAKHLLNDRQPDPYQESFRPFRVGNERVELAELRGFVATDLAGAFGEVEAIATGTRCTKPLYSLSINPSQPMNRDQYARAVDRIEEKLGLTDQARAVVFHVKNGREHCHVVWSRIDHEQMKARHMEFDHQKLREVARELVREFGHDMPKHLGEDRGTDRFKEGFQQATLASLSQEARSGISPEERRTAITEAYQQSDNAGAFRAALVERGYTLAQGDKRGLVVVDREGEVHSLTRQIEGAKAKDVEAKLALKSLSDLPTVGQAKQGRAHEAREQAAEAAQEASKPVHSVRGAEEAVQHVRDAQKADMKAHSADYRETLAAIRESEAERITDTKAAIKAAYREDWIDLFKRQREEMREATTLADNPFKRLRYVLQHENMDKHDRGARGYLKKAFNWIIRANPKDKAASLRQQVFTDEARADRKAMFAFVAKGKLDFKKLEKTHAAERDELADMQKAALIAEIQEIRQDSTERRTEAKEQHEAAIAATWDRYTDPIKEAYQQLTDARKAERSGENDRHRPNPAEDLHRAGKRDLRDTYRTPETANRSEAENALELARGNIDHRGEATESREKQSPLDAFFATFDPDELERVDQAARKEAEREREDERRRGDDGSRKMEP
jgi:hypothetical protein